MSTNSMPRTLSIKENLFNTKITRLITKVKHLYNKVLMEGKEMFLNQIVPLAVEVGPYILKRKSFATVQYLCFLQYGPS